MLFHRKILAGLLLASVSVPLSAGQWFHMSREDVPEGKTIPCGTEFTFRCRVMDTENRSVSRLDVALEWFENGKPTGKKEVAVTDDQGYFTCRGVMNRPGVLYVKASVTDDKGKTNSRLICGQAYEWEKLTPARACPADFRQRWDDFLARFREKNPLNLTMKKDEERSTADFTFWQIRANADAGRNVYAYYIVPAKEGKYPLLVHVPGAGPNASFPIMEAKYPDRYTDYALNGDPVRLLPGTALLILNVMDYDPFVPGKTPKEQMEECRKKPSNQHNANCDNEKYVHLNTAAAFLGILNEIVRRPEIDAENVGYFGFSQGGWYGLILGYLYGKFKAIVISAPGGCDMFAGDAGRSYPWPGLASQPKRNEGTARNAEMLDGANLIRFIDAPITGLIGLVDDCVRPDCVAAAFRVAKNRQTRLILRPASSHTPGFEVQLAELCRILNGTKE